MSGYLLPVELMLPIVLPFLIAFADDKSDSYVEADSYLIQTPT